MFVFLGLFVHSAVRGGTCAFTLKIVNTLIKNSSRDDKPSVGRTHTIVRLPTRIRRKDGTENFLGFVYVLDGFPQQRNFVLWVFMCSINISLFCVSFVSSSLSFPATTPRATTPYLYRTGYHAFTTTARLPRLSLSRLSRHSS